MKQDFLATKFEDFLIKSEDLNKIMGGTAAYVTGWTRDPKSGETWMDIGYYNEEYPHGYTGQTLCDQRDSDWGGWQDIGVQVG